VVAFLAVVFLLVFSTLPLFGRNKLLVVLSGSMEPAIKTGSVVLVSPQSSSPNSPKFSRGDIVSYKIAGSTNFVTHRIIQIQQPNSSFVYQTKGDANNSADGKGVSEKNIVGKVIFSLPFLGFIIGFAKTKLGLLLLVILPTLYVLVAETLTIWRESKKDPLPAMPKVSFPVILAFLSVTFFQTSQTWAFFSDSGQSLNNTFAAGQFAPPIAQTLVINEVLPDSSCFQGQKEAQWIEVYNGFPTDVNLKNFKITDGTNIIDLVTATNITAEAGKFVLLAHDTSIFGNNKCYHDHGSTVANLGGQLNIDVGFLQLLDAQNNVIDTVHWAGTTGLTPVLNQSIERVPVGKDSALGSNFEPTDFIVRETPTSGYGTNLVLNEFVYKLSSPLNDEWVEVYNAGGDPINLNGWTIVDAANNTKSLTSLGTIGNGTFKVLDITSPMLNNSGSETVFLKNPDGKVIDSHAYIGTDTSDQVIGRQDDAANLWTTCTAPTKGISNNGSC